MDGYGEPVIIGGKQTKKMVENTWCKGWNELVERVEDCKVLCFRPDITIVSVWDEKGFVNVGITENDDSKESEMW